MTPGLLAAVAASKIFLGTEGEFYEQVRSVSWFCVEIDRRAQMELLCIEGWEPSRTPKMRVVHPPFNSLRVIDGHYYSCTADGCTFGPEMMEGWRNRDSDTRAKPGDKGTLGSTSGE
jgi:hypothetical protein